MKLPPLYPYRTLPEGGGGAAAIQIAAAGGPMWRGAAAAWVQARRPILRSLIVFPHFARFAQAT